jgi:hypothetical protein
MNDKSISALSQYQKDESARKQKAVLLVIADFQERGENITVSAVSRAAGVSREFIYSHSHLTLTLSQATELARSRPAARAAGSDSYTSAELRADRRNLTGQVERQRVQIAELEDKVRELERLRKRWLGAQLSGTSHIDPEVHSELRITSERITAENVQLNRRVDELRRQVSSVESELAASRQAHAEDAQAWALTAETDSVIGVMPLRPPSEPA